MPQEAMLFLVIIAAVVIVAVIIGVWMLKKYDPEETESSAAPEFENFDDFGDKTVDHLNGNTSVVYAPPPAQNLDAEIARKKAELERLERAIENVTNPPPVKKKKSGGCFSIIGLFCLIIFVALSSGGDDTPKTSTNKINSTTRKPTVTATIEPKTKTAIDQEYISPDKIKTAVETSLIETTLFDYIDVSCDNTGLFITVGVAGFAEELRQMKNNGATASNKEWVTVKDSLLTIYDKTVNSLKDYGYTGQNCMLYLVNTENHDNIFLMIHGGGIVYDALAQ